MNIKRSQNRVEIEQYKKEIKESLKPGQKLFAGREINWTQLGAGNYIKSFFSKNYQTAVRELFFENWQENLRKPGLQSLDERIKIFSKVSKQDIPKAKKMELILAVSNQLNPDSAEVKAAQQYFEKKKTEVIDTIRQISVVTEDSNAKSKLNDNIKKEFKAITEKYRYINVKSEEGLKKLQKDFAKELTENLAKLCQNDKDNLRILESNVKALTNEDNMLLSSEEKEKLIDIVRNTKARMEAIENQNWETH